MDIKTFFDPKTFTLTYVVSDPETKDAVVIDPVLDYDPLSSRLSTERIDELVAYAKAEGLKVHFILESHAHADHITGAQILRKAFGAQVGIGKDITAVQETFKAALNLPESFATDGRQFDRLLEDGEVLEAGTLKVGIIHTPGHTPACLTFHVEDVLFTGDALFLEDYGTGRCDFPKGSAKDLYASVTKLYAFPDETRVFVGHDYQPGGRELRWETTIGRSKESNPHLRGDTTEEEFIAIREGRDAKLSPPRLIFQSIQINADGGNLPPKAANGSRYLTLPLDASAVERE